MVNKEIRSFFQWAEAFEKTQPWLILGKGPSFEKLDEFNISQFKLMSLNHVVEKLKVAVAHMIDLDVALDCADSIYNNAEVLVMPWVPHVKNSPGKDDLSQLVVKHDFLRKMLSEDRLFFYNHIEKRKHGNSPLVEVRFFSSEAAINLLATFGVRKIRTLGIDGGNQYANNFKHLVEKTLLSNGRQSFDKQFSQMTKTIISTGVDLAPLDVESPIKIYVATTEAQMLAVKVLEYSIRKHASMSVKVIPLHLSGVETPIPKDKKNWPRTPFSFQRFLIPQIQGYKGRAIYLDSDMQLFKDIKTLWMTPFNDVPVLTVKNHDETIRKPQFSVMLLNCEKLDWRVSKIVQDLDTGHLSYEKLMYEMAIASTTEAKIDATWNSLERFEENQTSLLHYTDMHTQPWISIDNPLGYLWCRDLIEAINMGAIKKEYISEHIALGFIRPSLAYQVDHQLEDPILLPQSIKNLDKNYKPPYQSLDHKRLGYSTRLLRNIKSILRFYLNKIGITPSLKKIANYLDRS